MTYQRIVSPAPSITVSVFTVDIGNQLIGIADYCNYPLKGAQKRTFWKSHFSEHTKAGFFDKRENSGVKKNFVMHSFILK